MSKPPRNIHRALNNATTWNLLVWETDLGCHAKIVACYLRTYMNDYQEIAFPSVGKVAGYCGISENTVRKALRELCAAGYLLEGGYHPKYQTRIYSICTPSGAEPLQEVSCTPSGAEPYLTNTINQGIYIEKKRFVKPSLDDVRGYCLTKQYDIDAEQFIAHYDSNGWKIGGKSPMVCWKSALTTWSKRSKHNGNIRTTTGAGGTAKSAPAKTVADRLRDRLAESQRQRTP